MSCFKLPCPIFPATTTTQPINRISGEHVIFLASFHSNDVTLSQFSVMCTLLQSFVESLTVVLPFYPVGTMERVVRYTIHILYAYTYTVYSMHVQYTVEGGTNHASLLPSKISVSFI
jgi:E3 ubiquitin-protein ligase DOA10